MSVASIFTEIASGLASFLPAIAKGVFDAFVGLFMTATTTEGVTTYAWNPLGTFALVALVMVISYKLLPMAYNFIVKRSAARKRRKKA